MSTATGPTLAATPDTEIEDLLARMTLAEQTALLSGADGWSVPGNDRLGIGSLRVTDGPNGARGNSSPQGGTPSAAFPVGISIGASWNPDLARRIGAAIAREVQAKGAHVLLAPTVNLQRSVTNGRNFECYSEDPQLTAALAVGYIQGVQSQGVAATIKHFVGNESEYQRTTISSDIDESTLRALYLRPFEAAVKEAGVWAVMTSYNRLNGTYTSEHEWLLRDVLRGDWGFDGVVMSDWYGSHSTEASVMAGLDLEMPGPTRDRGDRLIAAVEAGRVPARVVADRARAMLTLMKRSGALHDTRPFREDSIDRPEDRALIRQAATEGAVLLKNDGLLPLSAPSGRIAVIGPNAREAQIMGGGSSQLRPHYSVSPWQGLAARLGEDRLAHAPGCTNHRWEPVWSGDIRVAFFDNRDFAGPPVHTETMAEASSYWSHHFAGGKVQVGNFSARLTGTYTAQVDGIHHFGLATAGFGRMYCDGQLVTDAWDGWTRGDTFFTEGCDEVVGRIALTAGRSYTITLDYLSNPNILMEVAGLRAGIGAPLGDAAIAEAAALAAECETAILFVGRNGQWDTEGNDLDGIALPGRQDDLIRAVLAANPRTVIVLQTGGPVEMPWVDQAPAILQAWYPGQECGHAIADMVFGDAEPGGRLPQTFPRHWQDNPTGGQPPEVYPGRDGHVRYAEGVATGYCHYDMARVTPLFPFGHGLGYTRFELAAVEVGAQDAQGVVTASVLVTNTGQRSGSCVIQAYVSRDTMETPRRLQGFAKVTLGAGESRRIDLILPLRAFAQLDPERSRWSVQPGIARISIGLSSSDIRQQAEVVLQERSEPF